MFGTSTANPASKHEGVCGRERRIQVYIADDELIEKCVQGDTAAFETLVLQYERKVFSVAYRFVGNKEDAEDLAQEAFIKVFKSLKSFRGEASFSTWLYHIVANVCRDALRKSSRRKEDSLDCAITTENGEIQREVMDLSLAPEPILEHKEQAAYLEQLISLLTPEYRAVIVMREIQGFSYEEIARLTGCSLGTVKSRLNRARRALRDKLSADGELSLPVSRLQEQKEGSR